jgi:hypothetical protein
VLIGTELDKLGIEFKFQVRDRNDVCTNFGCEVALVSLYTSLSD